MGVYWVIAVANSCILAVILILTTLINAMIIAALMQMMIYK